MNQPGILIESSYIQEKVSSLGKQITEDYRGKELLLIGVLKGSFIFLADLARKIKLEHKIDFLRAASYGNSTRSSEILDLNFLMKESIEGKHVLLVEDIVDTGKTLNKIYESLFSQKPASLKLSALLVKEKVHRFAYPIDYPGFFIEDHFVVGYGLDFAEKYRHLDYIGILDENENPHPS